jgi:hypothetical protein
MPFVNYYGLGRNVGSFPYRVKLGKGHSAETAKRWADANSRQACIRFGWHGHVIFRFDDLSDALMFKLAFG